MTRCHIKADALHNQVGVRDLSADTASAEVWLVMLEVSSDVEQPCKLAGLFEKELCWAFPQELHLGPEPVLVLA